MNPPEFGQLAGEQWQRQEAVVPLRGGTKWGWVQHVLQEMNLYEIRRVHVPARVAGPAAQWLPGYADTSEVYVEMQAIAVEGG